MQSAAWNALLNRYEVTLDLLDKTSKNDDLDNVTRNKAASHLLSTGSFDVYFPL